MKRANNPDDKWVMEDKPIQLEKYSAEDPFHLEKLKKKERMNKNKKSKVMNVKRTNEGLKLPATLDITKNAPRHQKYSIERAVALAQKSTASMGNFDNLHSDEPNIKNKPSYMPNDIMNEQQMTTKIADRVLKKVNESGLDVDMAVRKELKNSRKENISQNKNGKRKRNQSNKPGRNTKRKKRFTK